MDLRKVKTLIDLVQQSGISELEIQEGEERVRISRGPVASAGVPQMMVPAVFPASTATLGGAATPTAVAVPAELQGHVLKSPMVGTFYRASAPGGKPFVDVGQSVTAKDAVCMIEAMKLLNEIEAGADGVVKEILVENGQPVEYGQPLMVIA
jgi:acetyl-CoA carboxylase biotin carboxyl carrier protein